MDWNLIGGHRAYFDGLLRERWSRLTDDDVRLIAGDRDALVSRIQERYEVPRQVAERQVEDMENLFLRDDAPPSPP
jgi:uncharacterized protein YjbJ (UPF0337 family)